MQMKLWCWCAVLALLITANLSSDEVPLYRVDNVLVGANFNDGAGSTDMTLIMRLSGDDEIYLDEGHDVRYICDPDNQDEKEGWTEIVFDDDHWEEGTSGVGFADGDDNTTVPAGRISIWTRYYFDAPNAAKIKDLILLADYDDQAIAWINGVKAFASGDAPDCDDDPPAWNASAGGVTNHTATELAAGQPNENRWARATVDETQIEFRFAGHSAIAVEARSKLAVTWGNLKK